MTTKQNSLDMNTLNNLIDNNEDPKIINEIIKKINSKSQKSKDINNAYDTIPEFFFPVNMLYIPIKINGIDINAFVDTGAQISVISEKLAKKCNLSYRINEKYKSQMIGIGTSKSPGKIFNVEIEINKYMLPCNLTVINDDSNIDMLFGLDIMKNHNMTIDLANNCIKTKYFNINFKS